jgi:hypothetical protein
MGLNNLTTILEKKGSKVLNKFLNEELIITEKLDTYRILFEKQNDKLLFFKKDNTPINLIERTITNVWEDAIIELTTIIGDIKINEGLRFGLAYTPVERPIRIPYSNVPKYVLTDVTFRKNNKVVETYDYNEVTKWASVLNVARPPVIFSGKLSEEQKTVLKKYGLREFDQLNEGNFAKIIENLFNKTYSSENIIEGIIIQGEKDLAQIISYEFEILNEAYQKEEYSRDYYDIILLSLNKFLDNYSIPVLECKLPDEIYLELISDVFNKFCQKHPLIVEGIKSEYLTPPAFGYYGNLNLLLIKNKKTLEILENGGKIYEALYKIILSSLKKPKKEFGLLTEESIKKFNTYVNLIKHIINEEPNVSTEHVEPIEQKTQQLNETVDSEMPVSESRSDNVIINKMSKKTFSNIDNMRIISSIQKAFTPTPLNVTKGNEKVIIYVTECQPFSASQYENLLMLNKTWNCPIILASVSNKRRMQGEQFHFSDNLVKAQLESLAIFLKDIVPAYFILNSWCLTEIFEYCRPKYEPAALITDIGKKSDFAIQLYFEDEVMNKRINVDENFNIGEIENKDKLQAFRNIEDKNFNEFNKLSCKPILGLFDSMIQEYKTWSGEIKTQFHFQENKFV